MANMVFVSTDTMEDIADAIRAKKSVSTHYKPSEMPAAIESINTGGDVTLVSKTITANGTYDPADDNADGYSEAIVAVPAPTLISKSISSNGTYDPASDNADGYSAVTVDVHSTSISNPPIKAVSGTFTLSSRSNQATIHIDPTDIDLSEYTVWNFKAILPQEHWADYEGDATYDNTAVGLFLDRNANGWPSTLTATSYTPMFLSTNANKHSWKSGGSYSRQANNDLLISTAGNSYKFLADVEYRYILVCVKEIVAS